MEELIEIDLQISITLKRHEKYPFHDKTPARYPTDRQLEIVSSYWHTGGLTSALHVCRNQPSNLHAHGV